jgi:hypothetical protein
MLKAGIVGLPNVVKATLFNAIKKAEALAANTVCNIIPMSYRLCPSPRCLKKYINKTRLPPLRVK